MSKIFEAVIEECPVCGQRHCPCTTCHGDPEFFLGSEDSAANSLEDDSTYCSNCGIKLG